MLTQVLAIPMAETLPTPNARKTCALSIWLLQVQRLPEEVLLPARDRIAFALRRGMEGELGKEGKKGSACDGLKVMASLLHNATTNSGGRLFTICQYTNPPLSSPFLQSLFLRFCQTFSLLQ